MELVSIIKKLRKQREQVDRLIAALEAQEKYLAQKARVPKRRGRKFMDEAERRQVSARMKQYWASRRAVTLRQTEPAAPGQLDIRAYPLSCPVEL